MTLKFKWVKSHLKLGEEVHNNAWNKTEQELILQITELRLKIIWPDLNPGHEPSISNSIKNRRKVLQLWIEK